MATFTAMPAQVDLPALERRIQEQWARTGVFARSLQATAAGPLWVFYEGPPTANGRPGAHHVEARVFKDLFPRFHTMKGRHVPRRAGWDCHGLPVELAVEAELGLRSKPDIERYGVAEFNARCRESVLRHVAEFERLSERMGYWLDYQNAYRTMDTSYIESVWWSLATIYRAGLLVEDFRVAPYCPRCQTSLSDHEVAQGYREVVDTSVYVRLPVISGPEPVRGADLLVWTTTPWTLPSNTAVAVHPDISYAVVASDAGRVVVAEPLVESVVGAGARIEARLMGRELIGTRYRPALELVAVPGDTHRVVPATFVTVEEGTGLVHESPAFGAEDFAVARANDLPIVNPVGSDGRFAEGIPLVGGVFVKEADAIIVDELERRGRLWRAADYRHSYPHCWRCDTPLLYYALPSWYIRTTAVRDRLLAENARTDWHPPGVRDGRYGDWLAHNVDWALSRTRYWGTPLPIWRCPQDPEHLLVVESLAELGRLAGRDLAEIDPHRPVIDEVTLACPHDGALMHRVPEVIDCWYDSGAMPFAQWGAPHRGEAEFRRQFPAQFIAEAFEQTRGWFYTLMAVGTLVFDRSPYESVLCLGLLVDEQGRKMSKHLGNIVDPFELFDRHGADAVRWLMTVAGNPWATRRLDDAALAEIVRKVLLTYWNSAAFLTLYAEVGGWLPDTPAPAPESRPLADRWLLAELADAVAVVEAALEAFDTVRAGRRLARFVDDLSNWYVRRNRRRFWSGPGTPDGASAFATLYASLEVLTRLLAPFVPFITEEVWAHLVVAVRPGAVDSVHLSAWPVAAPVGEGQQLREQVALARRLVELIRAARSDGRVRTRQPLGRAVLAGTGVAGLPPELLAEIAEEVNVVSVEPLAPGSSLAAIQVKPNFRELGRRFGPRTPLVARAIEEADPQVLAQAVRADGTARLSLAAPDAPTATAGVGEAGEGGAAAETVTVTEADLVLTEVPLHGWAVATGDGLSVAVDLTITEALRRAGLAREVLRHLQRARKEAGFAVTDRIEWWWLADPQLAEVLHEHAQWLARELLATAVHPNEAAPPEPSSFATTASMDGAELRCWLRVRPA